MKRFKIAVCAGIITVIILVLLLPFIQQIQTVKAEGELIKKQADIVRQNSETELYCNDASIQVKSVNYDNTSKMLSATIKNSGNITLSNIKFRALLKNDMLSKYNSEPQEDLSYGETKDYSALIENGCDIININVVAESCAITAREIITKTDKKFTFTGC